MQMLVRVLSHTNLQTFDKCSFPMWYQYQFALYPLQSWMTMEVRVVSHEHILRPDWVWDCWPWAAESELRLARGVDLRSVPRGYVLLSTCSCVSMSVKPVHTVCSHHAFHGGQRRQRMRSSTCFAFSWLGWQSTQFGLVGFHPNIWMFNCGRYPFAALDCGVWSGGRVMMQR